MHAGSRIADFVSRLVVFVLVLAGVVAVFIWYLPLIQKNQNLRREIALQEARMQALEQDIGAMNRQLELFLANSNAVERLVRENLGYARPGEYIVRFVDQSSPPPAPATPGSR
jgi:cell division protein FtsB